MYRNLQSMRCRPVPGGGPRSRGVRFCLPVLALLMLTAQAGEFRSIRPIPVRAPQAEATAGPIRPVPRPVVVKALKQVLSAWNTPRLREKLSERFYDAERVADAVDSVVPRDASIRLLGVRDVQTYEQKVITDPQRGNRRYRVSTVSVVAETQVEFNDPRQGFRRLRGVNEYLLEVREPL